MPIYIVRWPRPLVSLIKADSEEELVYRLDEAGDPGGCTWQVYDGPIWVDFDLPVEVDFEPLRDLKRPLSSGDLEVSVAQLAQAPLELRPCESEGGDTVFDMTNALRQFAFPMLHRALETAFDVDLESVDAEILEAAVREDLRPLLEYTWRQAQIERREDPEALMMQLMGVTRSIDGLTTLKSGRAPDDDEPDEA